MNSIVRVIFIVIMSLAILGLFGLSILYIIEKYRSKLNKGKEETDKLELEKVEEPIKVVKEEPKQKEIRRKEIWMKLKKLYGQSIRTV